jgi:hypothetical protein
VRHVEDARLALELQQKALEVRIPQQAHRRDKISMERSTQILRVGR